MPNNLIIPKSEENKNRSQKRTQFSQCQIYPKFHESSKIWLGEKDDILGVNLNKFNSQNPLQNPYSWAWKFKSVGKFVGIELKN